MMDVGTAWLPEPAMRALPPSPEAAFAIIAEPCPQILCRLLGLIAQQGKLVDGVEARSRPGSLDIRISVSGMDAHAAEIVAAKMQGLVTVRSVSLSCSPSGPHDADGSSLPN